MCFGDQGNSTPPPPSVRPRLMEFSQTGSSFGTQRRAQEMEPRSYSAPPRQNRGWSWLCGLSPGVRGRPHFVFTFGCVCVCVCVYGKWKAVAAVPVLADLEKARLRLKVELRPSARGSCHRRHDSTVVHKLPVADRFRRDPVSCGQNNVSAGINCDGRKHSVIRTIARETSWCQLNTYTSTRVPPKYGSPLYENWCAKQIVEGISRYTCIWRNRPFAA